MQVILLERVSKLGQMGDVVDVKPGYARNFLLPQGKAQTASETNITAFEKQKSQLETKNLETKKRSRRTSRKTGGTNFCSNPICIRLGSALRICFPTGCSRSCYFRRLFN